jgi:hypothetical protein
MAGAFRLGDDRGDGLEETIRVAQRLSPLSRNRCRRDFKRRFSASRRAQGYLAVYQQLIDSKLTPIHAG